MRSTTKGSLKSAGLKGKIKTAESSLVLKGEKHTSSVVSIRIKNSEELGPAAKEAPGQLRTALPLTVNR